MIPEKGKEHAAGIGLFERILPSRWDWPSVIGNFLLNFGTLEYLVFSFLKDHIPPEEFERVRSWHLKDRLARVQCYMRELQYPMEQQNAFSIFLLRVDDIRQIRNDLAHCHLLLHWSGGPNPPDIGVFNPKNLDEELEPSHIRTFKEILAAGEALTQLIEEAKILLPQ